MQPNETGFVTVKMDATRFSGSKKTQIFLTVGPEYISTATITLHANARLDVVFNPGEIDFGLVHRGQTPTRVIDVEYAGSLPWAVSEINQKPVRAVRAQGRGHSTIATREAIESTRP